MKHELQALAIDVKMLDEDGNEVEHQQGGQQRSSRNSASDSCRRAVGEEDISDLEVEEEDAVAEDESEDEILLDDDAVADDSWKMKTLS